MDNPAIEPVSTNSTSQHHTVTTPTQPSKINKTNKTTYRSINHPPHRHIKRQQPPHLPRKHRPRRIPPKPGGERRSTPSLQLRRLSRQETIDGRRERPASMRHQPPERSEIDQSLREREVHERARGLEVEFDDAFGVDGWVCADQFEAAVGVGFMGAQARAGGVDEDGRRAGGGGVEGGEEGFESCAAEVDAFVVGLQAYAGGVEVGEGVGGFGDAGAWTVSEAVWVVWRVVVVLR